MARVTRRFFLLSSVALSVGCTNRHSAVAERAAPAQPVRQPAVGQSWRYAKHDFYTRALIDDQIDRVAAVDHTVDIDSSSEVAKSKDTAPAQWGSAWLSKYIPHRETPTGPLPSEVQDPWGSVLVDPHWSQVQVYETPIPLWPNRLAPGWRTRINTKYKTPSNEDGLPWEQTMTAHDWETMGVPAGQFKALRFVNMINFRSADFSRAASQRQETIWFAPEVGRWVARESTGTYYMDDSAVDTPYNEAGYRWELLEWT
jgi:hypothetical protein